MSDPRWPDDGPNWPERDLAGEEAPNPWADASESGIDADPPLPEPEPPEPAFPDPGFGDAPLPDAGFGDAGFGEPAFPEPEPPVGDFPEPTFLDRPAFRPEPMEPPEPMPEEPAPTEPEQAPGPAWLTTEPEPEPIAPEPVAVEPEPTWHADERPPEFQPEPVQPPEAAPMEPEPEPEPEPMPPPSGAEAEPEPEPAEWHASEPEAAEPWWRSPEPAPEPEWRAPEPEPEPMEPEPMAPEPFVESGEPTTAFGAAAEPPAPGPPAADTADAAEPPSWNPKVHGERRRPTTAEQAVPWMIGVILALAGIVIVLLALIFTAPEGMLGLSSSPSPSPTFVAVVPSGSGTPSRRPRASETPATPTAEPTPGATATPLPEYGPLEMVYLGRPSALEPIYLLRRDFSEVEDPEVVAQAGIGVSAYAWSPDGRVGAAIIGERLVALTPGRQARRLADGVSAATFGLDSQTVYALRVVQGGGGNVARVLEIDYRSGDSSVLGTIRYPRPAVAAESPLREAQFIDDGGQHRIYAVADGSLVIWILGAPDTYRMDADSGAVDEIRRQPTLWSPDGTRWIERAERDNGATDLIVHDADDEPIARIRVQGLVSHIRWVRSSNEIVFTLGQVSAAGGVRQDLYVWDLVDGNDPLPLTSNGVSFGAEWVGAATNWKQR